jgi:hypothetical protein
MSPVPLQTMFVLLFPARVPRSFAGIGEVGEEVDPLPEADVQARMEQFDEAEVALLGVEYRESRRMTRLPFGRVRFPPPEGERGPDHADVFLVTHTTGAALWECWIPAPDRPLDPALYVSWLRSDIDGSPAAMLRERLAAVGQRTASSAETEGGFPFTILRRPIGEPSLDSLVAEQGADLVRLLYLDRSMLAFKSSVVEEELRRDFCLREGGISLLSQRGALDLRTGEGLAISPGGLVLAPRSALPLLISIELLLIERAVLQLFHARLSQTDAPESLPRLLELKAEVLDGLEEYRGTVAESNRFSGEVTAYGERLLGLDILHRALAERLESVTFEITTRYQQTMNVLQFSLLVVFGALTASSVAAVVAAGRYGQDSLPIVAWAVGTGLVAASAVILLLRRRLH